MKGSWEISADVNICFINYEMIKTHIIIITFIHIMNLVF